MEKWYKVNILNTILKSQVINHERKYRKMEELDPSFRLNDASNFTDLLDTIDQLAGKSVEGKNIAELRPVIAEIKSLMALPIDKEGVKAIRKLLKEIPVKNKMWTAVIECCGHAMEQHILG